MLARRVVPGASLERVMRILTVVLLTFLSLLSFSVSADTERPSAVANVNASSGSSSSIVVSWSGANDNVGVDGYNLYRDGVYYKTVFNTHSYIDTNVSSGRDYRYTVVAFDLARNYSIQSASAITNTSGANTGSGNNSGSTPAVASGRPAAPDGLRAQVQRSSLANLSWNAPSGGAEGYNIYRDGNYYTTIRGRTQYTASALDGNRDYSFYVVAFRNNKYSPKSASVRVSTGSTDNSVTLVEGAPQPASQQAEEGLVANEAPIESTVAQFLQSSTITQVPNVAPEIADTSYQCDPVTEVVAYNTGDTNFFTLSVDDESPLTLTYDADSSNEAVARVSVNDDGVFQVTALSRGESFLWLFAEDENGLADEFELRVVVE